MDIDHASSLVLASDRLQQFQQSLADDPILQELCKTIQQGWSESTSDMTEALHAHYDFRDELTVQDQLVFKGPVVIIPAAMHKEMLIAFHATNIGVEGCLQRAQESMFWPHMSAELKEYTCSGALRTESTNIAVKLCGVFGFDIASVPGLPRYPIYCARLIVRGRETLFPSPAQLNARRVTGKAWDRG